VRDRNYWVCNGDSQQPVEVFGQDVLQPSWMPVPSESPSESSPGIARLLPVVVDFGCMQAHEMKRGFAEAVGDSFNLT
jgi:hypothetical protein